MLTVPPCGVVAPAKQAQQGRFAGTIGAYNADHIARGHGEGEVTEKGAVCVASGEVLCDKGCAHDSIFKLLPAARRTGVAWVSPGRAGLLALRRLRSGRRPIDKRARLPQMRPVYGAHSMGGGRILAEAARRRPGREEASGVVHGNCCRT